MSVLAAVSVLIAVAIVATSASSMLNREAIRTRQRARQAILSRLISRSPESAYLNEHGGGRLARELAAIIGLPDGRHISKQDRLIDLLTATISEVGPVPAKMQIAFGEERVVDGFSDDFLHRMRQIVKPIGWHSIAVQLNCDVRNEQTFLQRIYSIKVDQFVDVFGPWVNSDVAA